ncbi:MAG: glycosyltransferase, partial [Candidatus Omnitrophica bacterium]|nr:glycosyltransferase [Candidatus Omnitrophota bacterium]
MKVALVHDWLIRMRGGEKVLEALCELFPDADLYTLIYREKHISDIISKRKIKPSFLNVLPQVNKWYQWLLPVFPFAIERFNLKGYDLVLSTSHCVAKGVKAGSGTRHICYCFTPMRYIWGFEEEYFGNKNWFFKKLFMPVKSYLREWDLESNSRVNNFISISNNVRERLIKFYGRESDVLYPPVDTSYFMPDSAGAENYFLIVSALVPYKRIDVAIEAFNKLNLPLVIIGEGPCEKELKKRSHTNITFMKWQPMP